MLGFFLRRVILASAIVVLALALLLVAIHSVPGDPANILLGPRATPEMKAALRSEMGLDQPILLQLSGFIWRLLHGDLGIDVFSRRPVADIVLGQLPYTLMLIAVAIGVAAAIGIPLGCYSAIHRDSWVDRFTAVISVGAIAIPPFVIAIYSVLFFSIHLKWLPAIGVGEAGNLRSQLIHLILPATAVGLSWVGYLARLVRSSMLEVLAEGHIRSARAHGLRERDVIVFYALPLAILPTITVIGAGVGYLLSSAVLAEIIFARPGIGKLLYDSVTVRNYPVVMGTVLVSTLLFIAATTLADILNGLIDPRIRERQ